MFYTIRFRRFKRFSDESIQLLTKGMSFIAGGNNSGKSTILQGLAIWEFCRTVLEAERGRGIFLPTIQHQGLGMSYDEFSPINIPSLRHLWTNLVHQRTASDPDGYTLRLLCTWQYNGAQKELEFGLALANDRLFIKATHSNLKEGDHIPRVAYLPPFAGMTAHEPRVTGAIRRRRVGEGLAGAVLRNILLDLQQKNVAERIKLRGEKTKIPDSALRDLRQRDPWELLQQVLRNTFAAELVVAPFREEYHSYIEVAVAKGIVKGYKITRQPGYRNHDLMVEGGGFLQWLSVYALATDPEVDVLLLDEPDAHLHCSLQQILVQHLVDLTEKTGKQVLVATHSTDILRQSPPERILEVSMEKPPRYLREEHQKVGLLAGLGTEYAPRIDAVKQKKRIMFVEGKLDFKILQAFTKRLGRTWPERWVEWSNKAGHKERKHIFLALQEEIKNLVAISIRDRDDESLGTVGSTLDDTSYETFPQNLHCKKWRRRNTESYLIWPQAIASAIGKPTGYVESILKNKFGIAIGDSFPDTNAPTALLQIDGKQVLTVFGAAPLKVIEEMPIDKIPMDIRSLINELTELAK